MPFKEFCEIWGRNSKLRATLKLRCGLNQGSLFFKRQPGPWVSLSLPHGAPLFTNILAFSGLPAPLTIVSWHLPLWASAQLSERGWLSVSQQCDLRRIPLGSRAWSIRSEETAHRRDRVALTNKTGKGRHVQADICEWLTATTWMANYSIASWYIILRVALFCQNFLFSWCVYTCAGVYICHMSTGA